MIVPPIADSHQFCNLAFSVSLLPTPQSRFTMFNHRVRISQVQQKWCSSKGDETWESLAAKLGEEPGALRWWGLI
jgi:hypothetical protein